MSNKGLRLLYCKECKRKRYCSSVPIPGYNFRKTCSKGHSWTIQGITLERIDAMVKDTIAHTGRLKDLFERDDWFYRRLKG